MPQPPRDPDDARLAPARLAPARLAPVRLAHLSDLHLAPMPPLPWAALNLKRALGAANWWRNRRHVHLRPMLDAIVADVKAQAPDHIVVSGDLVNLGLPAEHEAALRWLATLGPPDRVTPDYVTPDDATPDYVTVVPGNHDAYVAAADDPGYRRWQAYMQARASDRTADDDPDQPGIEPAAFPFVRKIGPVALIGLGSGVPTPPFVSAGRLGARQLAALGRVLASTAEAGLVRVVVIHHPPHSYGQAWRTGLKDARSLGDVLRRQGAELVLHGHFHRAQMRWLDGPAGRIPVLGVPSASAAIRHKGGDLAGYAILSIAPALAARPRIELVRRGLREPGGAIVELERTVLGAA